MAKKASNQNRNINPEAGTLSEATVEETVADVVVTEGTAPVEAAVTETVTDEPAVEVREDLDSVLSDIQALSDNADAPTDVAVRVKKSKLQSTDLVPCKSLFHGKLVYTSPINGAKWVWKESGAIVHVPMSELETMNNQKPTFLNRPLIVIMETSVIEDFNFGETYRKVASLTRLGDAIKAAKTTADVEQLRSMVRDLIDVGMRESVISEARSKRKENTLVNVNVINMLNAELRTDIG